MQPRDIRIGLYYPTSWRVQLRYGHDALLDRTAAWAIQQGVVQPDSPAHRSLKRMRSDLATVLAYPAATGNVAQFISDFIGWYLLLDDTMESLIHPTAKPSVLPARFDEYLSALAEPDISREPTQDRLLHGALDLAVRLRALSSVAWRSRFCESMRTYFYCGVLAEIEHRTAGTYPRLRDYVELRVDSSGSYPIFDLIEVASGHELPAAIAAHPAMRELRKAAAVVISWANDILSFHKERGRPYALNVPALLMHHSGMSEEEALHTAVFMHNDEVRRYISIKQRMLGWTGADGVTVRAWLHHLEIVMRGLLEWQLLAARYTYGRTLDLRIVGDPKVEQVMAL
ncbi:terpene synthase family protein [Sorangium sp. So ce281]|uniref:terpene synthase family protein n=1 Tax=unclassified Sorangium TaxID=2621164 RepID=UPI003F5E1DE6